MSQPRQLSEDEHKRAISAVVNQRRKSDLSGLLAAQRNDTLDEYLSPHLDTYIAKKYGSHPTTPTSTPDSPSPTLAKSQEQQLSNSEKEGLDKYMENIADVHVSDDSNSEDIATASENIPGTSKRTSAPTLTPHFTSDSSLSLIGALNITEGSGDTNGGGGLVEDLNTDLHSDDSGDYAPQPSFSGARGRRISQLAGTAMEEGCEVWAKLPSADEWVKVMLNVM